MGRPCVPRGSDGPSLPPQTVLRIVALGLWDYIDNKVEVRPHAHPAGRPRVHPGSPARVGESRQRDLRAAPQRFCRGLLFPNRWESWKVCFEN